MDSKDLIEVSVVDSKNYNFDYNQLIYDLDCKLDLLSSKADKLDYLISIASGMLCSALDILWVGDFDLSRGRNIASNQVEKIVISTAKIFNKGKADNLTEAVKILEKKFPLASDGNTPDFGGGLQHHLRDFAHHPTVVGLIFSLLTQFTGMSYGTDVAGRFLVVPVPEKSKIFIGENIPSKILKGTVIWFFHMISDVAGSGGTAGLSGGTGLPGPILSLAKELSVLPLFRNIKKDGMPISQILSKLFNGTLFAKRDASGNIIKESVVKFDFRGELGLGLEIGRQTVPVIANECIVRTFYFIRRLGIQLKSKKIKSFSDFKKLDWKKIKPINNPTISRMLLVATGVFTTIDITEAVATQKYFIAVNYVGVGRFAIALGEELTWVYKRRKIEKIKGMYQVIKQNTYKEEDNRIYSKLNDFFN